MNSSLEPLKSLPAAEPNLVFGGVYYRENNTDNKVEAKDPLINPSATGEIEQALKPTVCSIRSPRTPCRWSPSLTRAFRDRYCNRSKLRTPRTMTRLMQQHRDNERHRHRGLNASIKDITRQIPGFEAAAKETKIVKLQRIIHYICHLEEHIQALCQELAVGLHYKNLFLTSHVPEKNELMMDRPLIVKHEKTKSKKSVNRFQHVSSSTDVHSKVAAPSACVIKKGEGRLVARRLKVSSPTIDSTTRDDFLFNIIPEELELPMLAEDDVEEEQDEHEVDIKLSELQTVTGNSEYMSTDNRPRTSHVSKDAVLTDAWECLSDSGESVQMDPDGDNSESWVDNDLNGIPFHAYDDLLTVFPRDINLDSSPSQGKFSPIQKFQQSPTYQHCEKDTCKSLSSSQSSDYIIPGGSGKFTAVADYTKKSASLTSDVIDENTEPFPVQWDADGDYRQENNQLKEQGLKLPFVSFTNVLPEIQPQSQGNSVPTSQIMDGSAKDKTGETTHTDLRKTSWMNGFMMFSRMHRKDYIESHPGTPTAHISKIMGQDWRQLSAAEQDVYRERARSYSVKFLQV